MILLNFPNQLDTWVGETGRQLSDGQGRCLALARVILKDPALVILDEPFSNLDSVWLNDRSALLLAHDLSTLPQSDRHIHLKSMNE